MTTKPAVTESTYSRFLELLLSGDRAYCYDILEGLLNAGVPIVDLFENLLRRALYRVGELWEANRIPVIAEHMATSIVESLMNLLYPHVFGGKPVNKTAIIACVQNEFHQVGGRMVADIFEFHGWSSYFLGSNISPNNILPLIQEKRPDVLGFSVGVYSNYVQLLTVLEMVRNAFPSQEILVGGNAFGWGGTRSLVRFPSVTYIESLWALDANLRDERRKTI